MRLAPTLAALGLASALAGAGAPAPAQVGMPASVWHDDGRFRPILVQTAGTGPELRIEAFTLNPEIREPWAARGRFAADTTMQAIRNGFEADRDARADRMFRDAAWQEFQFAFDLSGEILTQAENVGQLSLTNINDAMTELGLFMTVWQVSLDLANGDSRAAGISAFRGLMTYARAKMGWPALNLFNPAIFILDQSLTRFGQQAWLARTDAWRIAYTSYYAEYDRRAEAAERGPQASHLPPRAEDRLRAMHARTEGGRSRSEWELFLYHAQHHARTPERFTAILEAELRRYTQRFWDSPQFEIYSRDIAQGSGTWGFARGASLTAGIRAKLEEELTATLMAMFIAEIFPRITHRNWIEATEAEITRLNTVLRPELNAPLGIVVSALDIDETTWFEIPLPAGGQWRGQLEPGQDRMIGITKYAWLAAGLPDQMILMRAEGPESQPIVFDQTDRAVVQFGQAVATLVARYRVDEGPAQCDHVFQPPSTRGLYRAEGPQRAPWMLDYAVSGATSVLIGRFDAETGWHDAATGQSRGDSLIFAEPYFDRIAGLSDCSDGFMQGQALAEGHCTLIRDWLDSELPEPARITCRGPASLSLVGAHLVTEGETQFFDLEGPVGAQMRALILQSLSYSQPAAGGAR